MVIDGMVKLRWLHHVRFCVAIAQLVERNLPKVDVAGSSPVSRSGASMST